MYQVRLINIQQAVNKESNLKEVVFIYSGLHHEESLKLAKIKVVAAI